MPKAPVRQTISRLKHLLNKIPKHGNGITSSELVALLSDQGIEVTKRTVERDLSNLCSDGTIDHADETKPYRWKRLGVSVLDQPGIEIADAVAVTLAKEVLHQLLPTALAETLKPKFDQAQRVLEANQSNNRFAQWADNVRYIPPSLPFLPPTVSAGVRKGVHEGLLKGLQLTVQYANSEASKYSDLTLHPLALIQNGPVAYLVATTFEYPDVRLYALHRMRSPKPTTEPANRPVDFSLDAFLDGGGMEFGDGKMIQLEARVSRKLACYLAETKLAEDQQLRTDNGYILTATVKNSWLLKFWILSQGEEITVISPASLRSQIGETLRAAAANYPVEKSPQRKRPVKT
jgi:predicted DNA-binding transcriptional regulator YafY